MRRAARRDLNESPIVDDLRLHGATVYILSQGSLPDLLVGYRRKMFLLEVKFPPGPRGGRPGQLTPDQIDFHEGWRGPPIHIVHSVEEARAAVGIRSV